MSTLERASDPRPAPDGVPSSRQVRMVLDVISVAERDPDPRVAFGQLIEGIARKIPGVVGVSVLEVPSSGGPPRVVAASGDPVEGGGDETAPSLRVPIRYDESMDLHLVLRGDDRATLGRVDGSLLELLGLYMAHSLRAARLHEQLLAKGEKIRKVTDICRKVLAASGLDEAVDIAVRAVVEQYGIYGACVAFVTPDGRHVEHRAHHAQVPVSITVGYRQPIEKGIAGKVARTRRSVLCPDVSRDPDYVALMQGVGSELCVPLLSGQRLVGLLDLNARQPEAFSHEDIGLMETLAGHLALVMEKARYLDDVERRRDYLENLLASAGDGIATLDRDGRITRWNRGMERILGHEASEVIGVRPEQLDLAGSGSGIAPVVARAMRGETIEGVEVGCTTRDGRPVSVALTLSPVMGPQGAPDGVSMIVRDVTERNRLERSFRAMHRQIREAEEKFLGMIERARDAIFFVEPGTGEIVQANARAEAMTGLNRTELAGRSYLDLHPSGERDRAGAHLEHTLGAGAEPAIELGLQRDGEAPLDVEVTASLMSYGGRQLVQWLCRDVSDRKRAEKEKEALHVQLVQSEKLSAIGQLISGVAHELNNPLTGVIGYSQLLASQDCDEKLRRGLDKVYAEAKRCHRVVQNLLTFARRHAPEKTWIGVNDIIESVLDLRAYQLRVDNIEVHRNLSKDIPLTMGDFHQLQQVFMNIIINAHQAFKHAQKGSAITIATAAAGGFIRVTIADDGPGIPKDNLQRIFDPFFTTKEPGQGTGLGLSLCYGIIEEHQGRIRVASEPGAGTVFTIDLPIVPPVVAGDEATRDAAGSGSRRAG